MNKKTSHDEARQELPLPKAMDNLIEECRMLLPGIQALFGFQLIAVFNATFAEKLSSLEQQLHLLAIGLIGVAIGLIGVAIALILTPAAYHRQIDHVGITRRFIDVSTRLMLWSMAALGLSICLDLYLVSRLILQDVGASLLITLGLLALFMFLWLVLPRSESLKRLIDNKP
jgi:O-antigen/teichoic acid export membrane protein